MRQNDFFRSSRSPLASRGGTLTAIAVRHKRQRFAVYTHIYIYLHIIYTYI